MSANPPRVYAIVVSPIVTIDPPKFTPINKKDKFMATNTENLLSIANKLSKNVIYIDSKTYSPRHVKEVLDYFCHLIPHGLTIKVKDEKGETKKVPISSVYPLSPGDFVFLFFTSHGGAYLETKTKKISFESNREYKKRLEANKGKDSFLPLTYYRGTRRLYERNRYNWNIDIRELEISNTEISNAKTKTLPYVEISNAGSTFDLPIYDYKPNSGSTKVEYIRQEKFQEQLLVRYTSTGTSRYKVFYSYKKEENSTKTSFFYTVYQSGNPLLFGCFPDDHLPSFSYLRQKDYSDSPFSSSDLIDSLTNAKTNLFVAVDACYSGGFVFRTHTNYNYLILSSSDISTVTWENKITGSYFVHHLKEYLDKAGIDARYKNAIQDVKKNTLNSTLKKNPNQYIRHTHVGEKEFDGSRSRNPKFPFHGNLQ